MPAARGTRPTTATIIPTWLHRILVNRMVDLARRDRRSIGWRANSEGGRSLPHPSRVAQARRRMPRRIWTDDWKTPIDRDRRLKVS